MTVYFFFRSWWFWLLECDIDEMKFIWTGEFWTKTHHYLHVFVYVCLNRLTKLVQVILLILNSHISKNNYTIYFQIFLVQDFSFSFLFFLSFFWSNYVEYVKYIRILRFLKFVSNSQKKKKKSNDTSIYMLSINYD